MGIEENKKVASRIFERFSAGDFDGALGMLTDDATWWIAGRPEDQPAAGLHNKEQITKLLMNMGRQLKNGLEMTVKSSIAESDKVALEVESYGELNNGRIYHQKYHMLI